MNQLIPIVGTTALLGSALTRGVFFVKRGRGAGAVMFKHFGPGSVFELT